jgi:DNA-binding MarR family transcriptional regulator
VGDHPQIAQIDLARRMRMDRATTMAVVNRMEARGYLERRSAPNDRRKQALHLTPDGETVLATAKALIASHEGWLKGRFSTNEVTQLVSLLSRIHEWFPTD